MWKSFYNPDLGKVETPQGTMTLPKIFLPLFLEMFLMNLMSTVNTFTLSFYSCLLYTSPSPRDTR